MSLSDWDPTRPLRKAGKQIDRTVRKAASDTYHALVVDPVKQSVRQAKRTVAPLFPIAHWPEQPTPPSAAEIAAALAPTTMPMRNDAAAQQARRRALAREYSRRGRQSTILSRGGGGGRGLGG